MRHIYVGGFLPLHVVPQLSKEVTTFCELLWKIGARLPTYPKLSIFFNNSDEAHEFRSCVGKTSFRNGWVESNVYIGNDAKDLNDQGVREMLIILLSEATLHLVSRIRKLHNVDADLYSAIFEEAIRDFSTTPLPNVRASSKEDAIIIDYFQLTGKLHPIARKRTLRK